MKKSFKGSWKMCIVDGLEDLFLKECELIAKDEDKFINFKRNTIFTKIIGNDIRTKDISDVWYQFIKDTKLIENIKKFKTNDWFGNPILYYYPKTGPISPGTLCFLSVLHDINTRLVNLQGKKICEIGSGYGGQSKIFLDYGCKFVDLIDRKETLSLAKTYLDKYKYANVNFNTTQNIPNKQYDVVVSNWCISELDREGTMFYINNVIKCSSYAYFLVNYRNEQDKNWFVRQLENIFSEVFIEEEKPKTNSNKNYAILCKK